MEYEEFCQKRDADREERFKGSTTAELLGDIQRTAFQVRLQNMRWQEQIEDRVKEIERRLGIKFVMPKNPALVE